MHTGWNPLNDIWYDDDNSRDNTGSVVWSSQKVLWSYIYTNKDEFDLSSVVELGSGTGMLSNLILDLGAKHVTASDQYVETLKKTCSDKINIKTFCFGDNITDWLSNATLIIASDVLYLPDHPTKLCKTINSLVCTVVICSSMRCPSIIRDFEANLQRSFVKQLVDNHIIHIIK